MAKDTRFKDIISLKRATCKYRRLPTNFKQEYQSAFVLFEAMDARADKDTNPTVELIKKTLLEKGRTILFNRSYVSLKKQLKVMNEKINKQIVILAGE